MDKSAPFIESVKEILMENNITANEFAKIIQCDHAAVGRWLNGTYFPDAESVIRISDAFNLSIDYLFGVKDKKNFTSSKNPSSFAERFEKLLSEPTYDGKAMTLYRVAKGCGIGNSALSKWKNSKKLPKMSTIIALSKFFNCGIDYILGRVD